MSKRAMRVSLSLAAGWLALGAVGLAMPAAAAPGDADKGQAIYAKRCIWCHGEEGDADTDMAERLNPPPRDFSEATYKFKTTGVDDPIPNDADLFRMVNDGMPGTAMVGWGDVLSEQEVWDIIAYIKTFGGLEEESPSEQVDYGSQVESSPESIAAGKKLFVDRCAECHGESGKGVATKKLKTDAGERTWPRNLTKPWTFRASNAPKDVYSRISVGIPGTQMPSFADPKSKKKLSPEERWHVANYVASLAEVAELVKAENTVIKADKTDTVPEAADDPRWQEVRPTSFFLVPQIIAEERFFTPSNDTVTVRALYDESRLALLVEWDDRTKSIPGDKTAESIADEDMAEDAVAVQLPITLSDGMEKPYFAMGDAAHPVNLWRWGSGTTEAPETVALLNAEGLEATEERDAKSIGLQAKGVYTDGTWRVLFTRPLTTDDADSDLQFPEGRFIPIAFSAWDGSNGETGSKHTLTTWYWLLLTPPAGMTPILTALLVGAFIFLGEIWWARSARGREPEA
ncbi:MAG: c-type cytochrome [Alphaproteobacteria bacterium]|nr:c-type cytochrome [Alphaproteobacteria bacterium]